MMSGSRVDRHQGEEPRWVTGREYQGADPLGVYEHTYSAISGLPVARRGAPRKGSFLRAAGISVFVLAAVALAAFAMFAAVRPLHLAWPRALDVGPFPRVPSPRPAYAPEVIGTTPARPKAALRVGEARDFAVVAATGPELHFGWTLDGRPAGTGPRWTYAPQAGEVGRRHIEVVVTGREGAERRAWSVRVRAARPPQVLDPQPASGSVDLVAGSPLRLRIDPRPATPAERLSVIWQVDGVPVGDGNSFTLHPARPGVSVVRALVRSDLGVASTREWRISVAGPPEEPPTELVRAMPPLAVDPPPPSAEVALQRERAPTRGAQPAPPYPRYAARPPERASAEQDVRRWLERYAAAWRAHDVDTLRRMGQVTTEDEAAGLRRYFESVRDLDVELNVVAMRTDGDRTTVRFTRLDRFRDPTGRLVLKESPVLEKQVVRTPDGLRFARPTG
jgi:hypothetical protein